MSWSLDHVHLKSANVNETVSFYQKHFGAEKKFSRDGGEVPFVGMDINGMSLLISGIPESDNPIPGTSDPQFGLVHFGLRCDDLEQKIGELKRNGIEFTMELTEVAGGTKMAFMKAPDEVLIELMQRS
jgi:lactoylglutathione lyase